MPYFTDLVKCGPDNTRGKTTIEHRAKHCVERFLLHEIEIINPDKIYCIGRRSYVWLKKYQLKGLVNKSIELKPLIHYGKQAGLPLKSADKKLIWQLQLGKLAIKNVPLSKLSYFQTGKTG